MLITSPAGFGHVQPVVPLARAIVERGHDVLWACPADGVAAVQDRGLRAVGTASALPVGPALVRQRFPDLGEPSSAEDWDVMFAKLWGAIVAPEMLAGLVAVVADWRPDLVVADAAEFAGHIVAHELGVPSVTKGFGALLPASRVAAVAREVAPLWRARGLRPEPYGGAYNWLYLDSYPPALQPQNADHVPRRQLLRPTRDDEEPGSAASARFPDQPADAPRVYVTMGTVFNQPQMLRTMLDALSLSRIRALFTVGPAGDPDALQPHPPHVRIVRYIPQSAVLPHCQAVVSHAGSGTVLGALAHGLPQLCLPRATDQFLNAAAIAAAGAGIAIPPDRCTPQAVAEAIKRLLDDQSFRNAAAQAKKSIAAMPDVEHVAARLESLG